MPAEPADEIPHHATTVLVVDDDTVMRDVIRFAVESHSELGATVIGEASDGTDGFEQWDRLRPDVVVLDQDMPGLTGLELAAKIREHNRGQHLVLCTSLPEDVSGPAATLAVPVVGKMEIPRVAEVIREMVTR